MKKLTIAFQMNDVSKINIDTDTNFALLHEAVSKGFTVYYYTPENLTLKGTEVVTKAQKVLQTSYTAKNYIVLDNPITLNLSEVDVIWLRQDPPFNMAYLTTTYFLDLLTTQYPNILVCNKAQQIRNYPEKIFAHYFTQFMPKTIVTRDKQLIKDFLKQEGKLIIKPLFEAKGDNVFLLEHSHANCESLIDYFLNSYLEPFIVQQFLPKVSLGDKRILLIDGEPLGAFSRIPTKGITSNLAKGGVAQAATLSEKELEICKVVGDFLKKEDLFFAGIDVIDNHLTEINLTSPTGLRSYYNLTGVNLAPTIWEKICARLKCSRTN